MQKDFLKLFDEIDYFSQGHSARVSYLATQVAKRLGLSSQSIRNVTLGAALHDAGKLQIPVEILFSDRTLTSQEWTIIHKHPELGYRMVQACKNSSDYAEIIYNHHELLDGKGYPRGLSNGELSMEVRIVTVSDIFEAIIADRGVINPSKTISEAKYILNDLVEAGKVDKNVVDALFDFIESENLDDLNIKKYLNVNASMLKQNLKISDISAPIEEQSRFVIRPMNK